MSNIIDSLRDIDGDQVRDQGERLRGKALDLAGAGRDILIDQVETNPLVSIAIALGIGFLGAELIRSLFGTRPAPGTVRVRARAPARRKRSD